MDPLKIADHAAQQSDRYLFILTLVVCFAGALWICKWMISRIESQAKISEERIERQTKLLEELFHEANNGRERVATVVSATAAHVNECTKQMHENTEMLRRNSDVLGQVGKIIERYG